MIIVYFLKEDDLNKKVYKFFCRVFCKCKRQNNFSTIQGKNIDRYPKGKIIFPQYKK
jgi:hypothetical protein